VCDLAAFHRVMLYTAWAADWWSLELHTAWRVVMLHECVCSSSTTDVLGYSVPSLPSRVRW